MQIRAELVNPFLEAATIVFRDILNTDLIRGKIGIKDTPETTLELAIIIGVLGTFNGEVVYGLNYDAAYKIAKKLMPGMSDEDIKNEYKDILGEIANMTTGNAMNIFATAGQSIEITAPNIVDAKNETIKIPRKQALGISLFSKFGKLEVNVSLT
ncbi:chemotaxis protein CheX [Leptospira wolffii]|uniref:Chemotaxis protein CheX n=1 Tax=Leptospira wolffii TaxID=409998 RepID=A0A2M9ZDG5_9LEPT|nr:chemotaxis protein CheX [Leptospira wolffii]EPG67675.1 CheC-like family protein [Leptospira wolffii serovar Khorat str. Khorat-H2]PJZ66414.1 chemotaxis protein CheX [Leptospira wolffii]TGK60020.1 chemotaxis protein CheX [Leptospira wolffii]TGK72364.1 chemotaxis protein CheX [Leptospira wolffii]TGK76027.1 chemotaxis protein CheX [Leptospira wolffii]